MVKVLFSLLFLFSLTEKINGQLTLEADCMSCVQLWLQLHPWNRFRFPPNVMRQLCLRIREWNNQAEAEFSSTITPWMTPSQEAFIRGQNQLTTTTTTKAPIVVEPYADQWVPTDCTPCVQRWLKLDPGITQRFSMDSLCQLCLVGREWNDQAQTGFNATKTPSNQQGLAPLNQPTTPNSPSVRKEYRVLSDTERQQFHDAIQKMKTETIDGVSKYDLFVKNYVPRYAPGAHGGPAFLPFHREFLRRFEAAMRQYYPDIGLPYWDSTLDQGLPNPADSILWSQELMGTENGTVVEGPFANWQIADSTSYLERKVGQTPFRSSNYLYKETDLHNFINRYNNFSQFDSCYDPKFEGQDGAVHMFVGGHMNDSISSPNDPIFFLHHCFVDFIWEMFRSRNSSNCQEYSPQIPCHTRFHLANETMRPFTIENIDGLSEDYVPGIYEYQGRPTCAPSRQGCIPQSPYLFCHSRVNKCLSKIRAGGNCIGLNGEDACYNSTCVNGKCA